MLDCPRDGRPGDDRGRRARNLLGRRKVGPIDVQDAPTGSSTCASPTRPRRQPSPQRLLSYFQGRVAHWAGPGSAGVPARSRAPGEPAGAATTCARSPPDPVEHRLVLFSCAAAWRPAHRYRARPPRGTPRGRRSPTTPKQMAGAITSDGSYKAARFMQLCEASPLPLVTLVDTPGMMVGPEAEQTALVRHCSRLFADRRQPHRPHLGVVLGRRAYGLGAEAMLGGQLPGAAADPRLADRRARADGHRGRGAPARRPRRARGDRGSRRARAPRVAEMVTVACASTSAALTSPPTLRSTT